VPGELTKGDGAITGEVQGRFTRIVPAILMSLSGDAEISWSRSARQPWPNQRRRSPYSMRAANGHPISCLLKSRSR